MNDRRKRLEAQAESVRDDIERLERQLSIKKGELRSIETNLNDPQLPPHTNHED